MTEYSTLVPTQLDPEFIRIWLNAQAAMGNKLITVYSWQDQQVFVFERTAQPPNWLVFDKEKYGISLRETAHA